MANLMLRLREAYDGANLDDPKNQPEELQRGDTELGVFLAGDGRRWMIALRAFMALLRAHETSTNKGVPHPGVLEHDPRWIELNALAEAARGLYRASLAIACPNESSTMLGIGPGWKIVREFDEDGENYDDDDPEDSGGVGHAD